MPCPQQTTPGGNQGTTAALKPPGWQGPEATLLFRSCAPTPLTRQAASCCVPDVGNPHRICGHQTQGRSLYTFRAEARPGTQRPPSPLPSPPPHGAAAIQPQQDQRFPPGAAPRPLLRGHPAPRSPTDTASRGRLGQPARTRPATGAARTTRPSVHRARPRAAPWVV